MDRSATQDKLFVMSLADKFLLRDDVVFLNHGSFGATPRTVFEIYQSVQRELETQPVAFLGREFNERMQHSRSILAAYVGIRKENIVYLPNATQAINTIARSLKLGPGDQVLTSDHEYGAMERLWRFLAHKRGFELKVQTIPLPIISATETANAFLAGISHTTKAIFISHLTSTTALLLPVEEICRKAREQGILTVIDGAHTPGQITLALESIGADFYTGNLHKWLCAPKGSGFLYAHPDVQLLLEPLVVSWGWESENPSGSIFIDHHEWQGTRDPSAYLAVPEAIRFLKENNWNAVRSACHLLAVEVQKTISKITRIPPIADPEFFVQMVSSFLPPLEHESFQKRLYDDYQIEVPIFSWNGRPVIRISIQGYNDQSDVNALTRALEELLPQASR